MRPRLCPDRKGRINAFGHGSPLAFVRVTLHARRSAKPGAARKARTPPRTAWVELLLEARSTALALMRHRLTADTPSNFKRLLFDLHDILRPARKRTAILMPKWVSTVLRSVPTERMVISMTPDEASVHEDAINALIAETHVAPDIVRNTYRRTLAQLESDARLTEFLVLFAVRKTREALKPLQLH